MAQVKAHAFGPNGELSPGAEAALTAWAGPGGGSTLVQIGTLNLPASPSEGESVSVLADSTTVIPAGVTWDSGGEPTVTDRLLVTFVWSGEDWVGTYGLPIAAAPEPPDVTNPTAGTLGVVMGVTTADGTVTGAADETELDAAPYSFRVDAGTWSAWQAGATYEWTGLTASTEYDFQHRVRDAAGNITEGAVVTDTTDAPSSDTTDPTPGTLASSAITDTSFTLTVSGASDETALHATPYAFSTDNGSTWSAYQSGASFDASGLTAETEYTCVHRVRDAAANVATGTPITVETGAGTPAASLEDAIMALSPSGYWKLDETSGTTAADSSGNGRNGAYTGSYTLNSVDGAPLFSGGNVSIPDNDLWSLALRPNGATIFALIRATAITGSRQMFAAKGTTGQFEWALELTATGALQTQFHNATASALLMSEVQTGGTVPAEQWVAVAMRVEPTPAVGSRPSLHYNSGTPLSTYQATIGSGSFANGTAALTLGSRTGQNPFGGAIRHAAIFDDELTTTDIADLVSTAQAEGLIP